MGHTNKLLFWYKPSPNWHNHNSRSNSLNTHAGNGKENRGNETMNFINEITYSLILFLLYIIIRIGGHNYFNEERGKGSILVFFFIGIVLFIFINREIGIIIFLISLVFLLIPARNSKGELDKWITEIKNYIKLQVEQC